MQLHNLFPFPEERKTRRRVGRSASTPKDAADDCGLARRRRLDGAERSL